ncbi:MAG TPA: NAD(P)H-dependent oxidoreductase [Candidatus Microsaccharimonas sp.]|jgi:NAD(P)H-dependent FMN reductase
MSNVLVVLSSAREGRAADQIFELVKKDLEARDGVNIVVADLKEINLPFFAHALAPASPDYAPTDAAVIAWGKLVTEADAIVWLTPEYNHSLNAIQKNAIDSLRNEWIDKPIAVIGYGWTGGSLAVAALDHILPYLKADYKQNAAELAFMQDINVDGTALNEVSVTGKIKMAIDEIA